MIHVYCPHCKESLEVEAQVSDAVKCIECGRPFIISKQQIKEYKKANASVTKNIATKILKIIGTIIGILFLVVLAVFLKVNVLGTNNQPASQPTPVIATKTAEQRQQDRAYKVADDYIQKYEIALQQGDEMQICVQARLVSTAFLNAKDQEQYNKWKAVESQRCEEAGVR